MDKINQNIPALHDISNHTEYVLLRFMFVLILALKTFLIVIHHTVYGINA